MELHFFKEFLMISHPTTVFLLLVFLLILAMIHHLEKKGTSFGKLVTIGTVSGALLGIFIQVLAGFPDAPTKVVFIKEATKWYSLVGGGFIDLIRMLVVPLVLTSIIHVILHMNEGTNLKKLVGAMLATNLGMVALAAIVGLSLGSLFGLGAGSSAVEGASKMRDVKPVVDTFRALIPMNPVKAMADTNVIAVVIFGVVIGGIAQLIKKTGTNSLEAFTKLFDELHLIMGWACDFIIGLMPYGVVALLANTLATRGLKAVMDMGLFILLLYLGLAIMFAAEALLPLTVETLTHRLGVSTTTANTVASFGTTAGMQGCAGVFPGLVVVYIANVSGIPFDLTLFIMSIVVIALGSIGIAGVPGTATMAASVSLSGTGLGAYFSSISPVLAIDPIIDMGRTMLNVSGSMTNAIVVDKIMGTFDEEAFKKE